MGRIVTHAEIEAAKKRAVVKATARASSRSTISEQGTMPATIEAGTNEAVATTADWDRNNFATVVPAKHLPQQRIITLRRDANGRETIV